MDATNPQSEESRGLVSISEKSGVIVSEPLWTVLEVAQYLRLKPGTVRAMARRGELPAVKIGRVWRFRRAAVSKIMQENP